MRLHSKLKMRQNRLAAGLRPARTRKRILSVPLDSKKHSGRLVKENSLTPLAPVMFVLQLGMDEEGGRTRIGKGRGGARAVRGQMRIIGGLVQGLS